MSEGTANGVRADRWLWAIRLFKTRSEASRACVAGHVKCGDRTIKAAGNVRIGDRLNVQTPGGPRIVEVVALADKRGSAEVARTLYVDHTPAPEPKEPAAVERDRGAGRPEKRDRRLLRRLRGRE